MTRAELANVVNRWLWEHTGRRFELDDHLIGKWERGVVRQPIREYRAAQRAVPGADTDAELGFRPSPSAAPGADIPPALASWTRGTIVADATNAAEWDLLNRRDALQAGGTVVGAGLLGSLAGWLGPLAEGPLSARSGSFALAEVEALESLVATFREWRSTHAGLARHAVDYLDRALDRRDPSRTRNRAFDLESLGWAHLLIGEPDRAAATVGAALPHLDGHRPGRLGRKLVEWRREAAPFATVAAVAEVSRHVQGMPPSIGRD
ncbi:MAG: hypothetical protein ACRDQ0_15100 [Pseudonocardia sp.]